MEPTIYLNFNGDCLEAMTHYARVLGGKVEGVFRNGDSPDPQSRMPGGDDLVMNMLVRLGGTTMMASDAPEGWYSEPTGFAGDHSRRNCSRISTVSGANFPATRARVSMEPGETFWAERFGMFTDRYGTPWMLNYTGNKAMGGAR